MKQVFSTAVLKQLGYYVYIYIDPRTDDIFYVGKGKGNRAFAHLTAEGPSEKKDRIAEIRSDGEEPKIEILVHGLKDEETALKVEAAIIDLLGIGKGKLTNKVRGYESRSHGRMTLSQIRAQYESKPVEITDPSILIRINRQYRHTMTPFELYEATRRHWKIGSRREKVKYAMAVYAGVVREVYLIAAWLPPYSTFHTDKVNEGLHDRWEFVGKIAEEKIRRKYLDRDVSHYFAWGSQNPFIYAGMPDEDEE